MQQWSMSEALALLVDLLDLERIEVNTFRGRHPEEERQRTFGGQVAAQALMAAGRTVEVGGVHSLHSYFLRPGDPSIPILYEVDRIRDGRSFTTRRVVAIQHGRAIYNMQASFHTDEDGLEHQFEMPDVPGPRPSDDSSTGSTTRAATSTSGSTRNHPIDQRFVGELPWSPNRSREPRQRVWIKADGELPEDPLLHACVITYASDMSLIDSVLRPHSIRLGRRSVHGREPGPLHVVPPRAPRRRVAALRHGLAHRPRRPRSRARLPLESRTAN